MNRNLSFLIATAAVAASLAGSASAANITVSLAGKSPQVIRVEVEKAAWSVCKDAYRDGSLASYEMLDCARTSTDAAMAEVRKAPAWSASTSVLTEMASNTTSAPPAK